MTATFYVGDALEVMATLPEKSVDLVLTSPPFLALRSYLPSDHPDKALEGGSQATPGAYIDWLLDVVEACARVLAPHGSLCFELGDTYSGASGWQSMGDDLWSRSGEGTLLKTGWRARPDKPANDGWPLAKSLSLIPESFRFAMVYGHNPHTGRTTAPWRLRNVIRWVRPNPPVGALGDKFRPATSELMVFCKAKDRFFDLDAVREPWSDNTRSMGTTGWNKPYTPDGVGPGRTAEDAARKQRNLTVKTDTKGGAPPLDWWNIPPGGYVIERQPVNPGEFVDGTLYITSAGCPLHEGLSVPTATAPHGEPEDAQSNRSFDTDESPVPEPQSGSAPTDQPTLLNPEDGSSDSTPPLSTPSAKRRSKASNRTAPAPDSTSPDTASDRTRRRIDDTSSELLSDGPHPDSPESRTSAAHQAFLALESYARTGHKPAELEGCSCSFAINPDSTSHYAVKPGTFRNRQAEPSMNRGGRWNSFPNVRIEGQGAPPLDWWEIPPGGFKGAHYAVWPPELLVKPIKAMCPEKVCRRCGEASRRISEAGSSDRIGSVLRKAREAAGLSQKDVAAWFPSVTGGTTGCVWNWENGANVPMAEQWERLKEGLGISDEFDYLIPDRESVTYADVSPHPSGNTQNAKGEVYQRLPSRKDRIAADRFSDCGHDDYRPGIVLDPFAGSGTTLAVATGHGRDAIGIDLDERNYELSLDRVGPLILQRGEIRDGTGPPD